MSSSLTGACKTIPNWKVLQVFLQQILRIQAHCRLIGLYRRRDEPLGQALLHRGALSSSAKSSTGRHQCNSLQEQHQSMATASYVPTPHSQFTHQKGRKPTQHNRTPNKPSKETNSGRGRKEEGELVPSQKKSLASQKLGLRAHGRITCDVSRFSGSKL